MKTVLLAEDPAVLGYVAEACRLLVSSGLPAEYKDHLKVAAAFTATNSSACVPTSWNLYCAISRKWRTEARLSLRLSFPPELAHGDGLLVGVDYMHLGRRSLLTQKNLSGVVGQLCDGVATGLARADAGVVSVAVITCHHRLPVKAFNPSARALRIGDTMLVTMPVTVDNDVRYLLGGDPTNEQE